MTQKATKITAKKRQVTGRQVKRLRSNGKIPANVFGKKTKSTAITLDASDFNKVYQEAGETTLIELKLEGEKTPRATLISQVQKHPVTDAVLHVDFHQVDLKEKVTAEIPLELVGEAPAVKEHDAVLFQVHTEVEVEALPTDLIDQIEIDVSSLKDIGQSILSKDLKVDRDKITLLIDDDEPIVIIQEKKEEEVAPPPPTEAAVPEEEAEAAAKAEAAAEKPEEEKEESDQQKPKDSKKEEKEKE